MDLNKDIKSPTDNSRCACERRYAQFYISWKEYENKIIQEVNHKLLLINEV